MPEEETTQTQVDGANPAEASQQGTTDAVEPNAAAAESPQLTEEQIQELRTKANQYDELQPEFTRRSQELSEHRRRLEEYQARERQAQQQQQQQQDPVALLEAEIAKAEAEMNFEALAQLRPQYRSALLQQHAQISQAAAIQAARQQHGLLTGLSKAEANFGAVDQEELAKFASSLQDPANLDAVVAAQLFKKDPEAFRKMLNEKADAAKNAKVAAANAAAAAASGMTGRANGAIATQPETDPHPHPQVFFTWSESKRQKHIADKGAPPYITVHEE